MGRAFRRRKARRDRAEAQCELPTSPPPPPPERLPCGCWNRPELYSKTCPQHQAQAEFLSDQREDREAREVAKEFPPELALLEVAVPLWIERLRPLTWEERMKRRDACLAVLATGKDEKDCLEGVALLACGARGKPGQVADAFNRLAEALALGALQPGGVKFAGMRWDASEPIGTTREAP